MNKNNLRSYAPAARLDFIAAVSAQANLLGIHRAGHSAAEVRGDVVVIDGRDWPAKVAKQRANLTDRIAIHGFSFVMEEIAYTWFNRFAALRFMEIHGYLDHGWRVLSNQDGGLPEILAHAAELSLEGLSRQRVVEMQLAGNQDNEIYKMVLVAQCNELANAMPFLFERIDDETELLLPENLLRTDSIIAKMVAAVPEADWAEIEVIGWLYQFYISDKKNEVMGKTVSSDDIPAATQLFTPNWIVKYLVQNSVGRLWLMANKTSALESQWTHLVARPPQSASVDVELDLIIADRIQHDGLRLNPESLLVLDPACGSGHILVEAYDVLKAIYLERGYRIRDIPRLILEKNIYGLDIDDRASQLACFALLMKARADDRRILEAAPVLNVVAMRESSGIDLDRISEQLRAHGIGRAAVHSLLEVFTMAKTFGSLVEMPESLVRELPALIEGANAAHSSGDLYARAAAEDLLPLLIQAKILSTAFDAVVANPPYMGGKGMNAEIKVFGKKKYPNSKTDLFAMFMERGIGWCKPSGLMSMVTMQSWMFLSSYENLRAGIVAGRAVHSLVQIGYNSFPEMNSKIAQACAFVIGSRKIEGQVGQYVDLNNGIAQSADKGALFVSGKAKHYSVNQDEFHKIPGAPFIYWASDRVISLFENNPTLGEKIALREGIHTADNERFLRYWHEVDYGRLVFNAANELEVDESGGRWVPYNKGGSFRKWFGNNDLVIAFDEESRNDMASLKGHVRPSQGLYFKPGGTWSALTSGSFGVRFYPVGYLFDSKGQVAVGDDYAYVVSLMNSSLILQLAKLIMPTLDYKCGDVKKLPYLEFERSRVQANGLAMMNLAKDDWNSFETSFDFTKHPMVGRAHVGAIDESWKSWENDLNKAFERMRSLEQENNTIFISAAGLDGEMSPQVGDGHITLARPNKEKEAQRLISYAVGCAMGRFSLSREGIVYAGSGNVGFDPTIYGPTQPSSDGIVPLTGDSWFQSDGATMVSLFISAAWGPGNLDLNLSWVSDAIGGKDEQSHEQSIRRYLAERFYKDHLQAYKKRPIYWLFSSGKLGAFQALVYMHRYNEATLPRLRSEYVVPLLVKMNARLEALDEDIALAPSTVQRVKSQKQQEALRKQSAELMAFDEKLRHYADSRIAINLDDGVKKNYAMFGDLLAESRFIVGATDE